jgi:hypothetical protein
VNEFELGVLWDEYGLVGDIIVGYIICIFVLIADVVQQPFTNDFPRADIHQLIAPDLLHQIIKGTFKDHLVTWVEQYLILKHGQVEAQRRLDDIDRR